MIATVSPVAPTTMDAPTDLSQLGLPNSNGTSPRQFRKHKSLPRPRGPRYLALDVSPSKSQVRELSESRAASSGSPLGVSLHVSKRQARRIDSRPELPPTPPTHSRTSSGSHSALPSSPTLAQDNVKTPTKAPTIPPTTPPDQRSPPTPDVTPPQPMSRPKALRPLTLERGISRNTTAESRTDSFRTAREEPISSEDEDSKSTIRPTRASGRTSQATVRNASGGSDERIAHPKALDLALACLAGPEGDTFTPRTLDELARFDGEWTALSRRDQHKDAHAEAYSLVKKGDRIVSNPSQRETKKLLAENAGNSVVSTHPAKAVRQTSMNEKVSPQSSKISIERPSRSSTGPFNSDSSVSVSQKRSSGISSRSLSSTVVEAFLIDSPQKTPQRQRTLRHVRKRSALREPLQLSKEKEQVPAPTVPSVERGRPSRPPPANSRPDRGRHDSYASNTTVSSVSSGKSRREVWKSGGIPVVVVPDRRSSRSRSREPSLRSTSSRRSKRTQSLGSTPVDTPVNKESGPVFERPARHSRAYSLSDSADTRTIDFPPAIPARSSSLSAPTSRNTSRAGSLTAGSLKTLDSLRHQPQASPSVEKSHAEMPVFHDVPKLAEWDMDLITPHESRDNKPIARDFAQEPKQLLSPILLSPVHLASPRMDTDTDGRLEVDNHDDSHSIRRYSSRNTPFSILSMETNGTAPEVSEAQAVHMYAHQNSSLLMVNHSARPSQGSDIMHQDKPSEIVSEQSVIMTTVPDAETPVTPPQPQFSLDDVDSPLRNPRAPPEPPIVPPAITFTSATPSGATPGPDKAIALGNYFETMAEVPGRRDSLVKRALSRHRRNSVQYPPNSSRSQGFLSRTFSLTRSRSSSRNMGLTPNTDYPHEDDIPHEHKLHPFWRPQVRDDETDDEYEDNTRGRRKEESFDDEEYLKYPLVDNRPPKPKRRFSEKMKRTFAVLPIRDDENITADDGHGPERRTIRRTSSGNLKVMRHRNSASSLRRRFSQPDRPFTAPDEDSPRSFWRGTSVHRGAHSPIRRRFSLGNKLEEIQSIPRRLSERRREKRTRELRQKISGPRDFRDGVEDMIRSGGVRDRDGADEHLI